MKTRILFIMTLMLAVVLRVTAATGYGFQVGDVDITSDNCSNIVGAIPSNRITVGTGGSITYVHSSKTLTLKNVTITRTGSKHRGITNISNAGLTVVFEGTVKLDAQDASPILCTANTTLKCANGGKVTLYTSNSDGLTANGCTITIQDADMKISDGDDSTPHDSGIMSDDYDGYVEIYDSKVYVGTFNHCVHQLKSLTIGGISEVRLSGFVYLTVNKLDNLVLGEDMIISSEGAYYDRSKKTIVSDKYPDGCKWSVYFETTAVPVNSSNFPDYNFREVVSSIVDTNGDNYLGKAERNSCKTLNLRDKSIGNLRGIWHFPQLEKLNCGKNHLLELDLTGNTALKELICDNNKLLSSLSLSGYTALTTLKCYNDNLDFLDVSGCTALESLVCYNNQLKSLNVRSCTALTTLDCSGNQLASLYVSGSTALTTLDCSDNQLISLDVSNCTKLNDFKLSGQDQLRSLNVSGCTSLSSLNCSNNQLNSLNVSGCTGLKRLYCNSNQLESLDVMSCTALQSLDCNSNQLESLSVKDHTALQSLNCAYNRLNSLNISGCTALQSLDCNNNQLKSISVKDYTTLQSLDCSHNQLTSLNASGCTALKSLSCKFNQLNTLNVANCKKLESSKFTFSDNSPLTSFIASHCETLFSLVFYDIYCPLTLLNVSGCTALNKLHCKNRQLTSISVSGCTALKDLNCSGNQLTSLNVSTCTALEQLDCSTNSLTSLMVNRDNDKLVKVYCQNNKLSASALQTVLSVYGDTNCNIYLQDWASSTEQNEFNSLLFALAKSNNWTPYYYDSSRWYKYDADSFVTGIDAATALEETIDGDALRYNLQGQRVGKDYHGVVIVNGRKVRVK